MLLLSLSAGVTLADTCLLEFDNGVVLHNIELVATPETMSAGLSNREAAGQGMLFSWPAAEYRAVWMKGTRFPLSAAFVGAEGSVQSIIDLQPLSEEFRWSVFPATDVLELEQGQFEEFGIDTDTVLMRRNCKG